MKVALTFVLAAAAGLAIGLAPWPGTPPHLHESHFENVLGTSLDVKLQARSDQAARSAEQAILGEIARQAKILSGDDADSEFSRWTRTTDVPTRVAPELIDVLSAFDDWRTRTSGALDPSTEALSRVWSRAAAEDRVPSATELGAAVGQVRQHHWIVDRATSTATRTSVVPIRLDPFTKSVIVDRAARLALTVRGVQGVLLSAGGDVVVRGAWTQDIGIEPMADAGHAASAAMLSVRDAVVATSGSARRGFDIDGKHYSHVLDPRTGRPAGHVLSATVVSPDAVEAGALATAFCVLTPEESAALAGTRPGVEYALILDGGRRVESRGWRHLEVRRPSRPSFLNPIETLYAAEFATRGRCARQPAGVQMPAPTVTCGADDVMASPRPTAGSRQPTADSR